MTDLTSARKNARTDADASAIAWAQDRIAELEMAAKLPLLFHSGGGWTEAMQAEWLQITGTTECTTKVMCDYIRMALAGSGTYDHETSCSPALVRRPKLG